MPTPPGSDRCPPSWNPPQKQKKPEPRSLPKFFPRSSSPPTSSSRPPPGHQAPESTYAPGNVYPNPQNSRYPPISPAQVTHNFDDGPFPPVVTKSQLYPTRQTFWKPHQHGREEPLYQKPDSHQDGNSTARWPPSVGWQENSARGFQTSHEVKRPSRIHFNEVQWGEPSTSPIIDAVQKLRAGGDEEAVGSVKGPHKVQIEPNTPARVQSVKAELVESSPEVGPKNEDYGVGDDRDTNCSEGNSSSQEDLVDLQTALRDLAPFQSLSPRPARRQGRPVSQVHGAASQLDQQQFIMKTEASEPFPKEKITTMKNAAENTQTNIVRSRDATKKPSAGTFDDAVLVGRDQNASVESFRTAQEEDFEFVEKPESGQKGRNGQKSKWGIFGRRSRK